MGATSGQQFIGGTYGPGFSFPPGSYIEGATIIAPSVVGEGSILVGVTFQCQRGCGPFGNGVAPHVAQSVAASSWRGARPSMWTSVPPTSGTT